MCAVGEQARADNCSGARNGLARQRFSLFLAIATVRQHDDTPRPPEQSAEELTELARHADDPAARVWYLEWARAFRRLASIKSDRTEKDKRRPH